MRKGSDLEEACCVINGTSETWTNGEQARHQAGHQILACPGRHNGVVRPCTACQPFSTIVRAAMICNSAYLGSVDVLSGFSAPAMMLTQRHNFKPAQSISISGMLQSDTPVLLKL